MPDNPNLRLYDLDVRHQVGLSRLCSSLSSTLVGHVDDTAARVVGYVRDSDLGDTRPRTRANVQELVDAVSSATSDMGRSLSGALSDAATDLVEYEVEFQSSACRSVGVGRLAHPSTSTVVRTAQSSPVVGRLVSEWGADVADAAFRRTRDVVRRGLDDGENLESVVRRLTGTRRLNYRDGVYERVRRDASGLTRTVSTYLAVLAKTSLFELNPDVFDREMWCSTLDTSTGPVCRSRDGTSSKLGSGPRPPAHWACRSTVVGLLRGHPAPVRETYAQWLKRQPEDVQDEVLGRVQARLWRDGGVDLSRFVDRSGEAYTVAELRVRERAALSRSL